MFQYWLLYLAFYINISQGHKFKTCSESEVCINYRENTQSCKWIASGLSGSKGTFHSELTCNIPDLPGQKYSFQIEGLGHDVVKFTLNPTDSSQYCYPFPLEPSPSNSWT